MRDESEQSLMENSFQNLPPGRPRCDRARAPFGGSRLAAAAAGLVLLVTSPAPDLSEAKQPATPDYLVLSLSWSPTYCGTAAGERDRHQCGTGRRFAFIVHGLWPQYKKGWPEFCATGERWVLPGTIEANMDIMPSKALIIHQWRKHGTCSGYSQADYFATLRSAFERVRIPARYLQPQAPILTTPARLAADFVKTNRDLTRTMISIQCGNARDRARLSELRICFDLQGKFISCGMNEQRQCQARDLILPPVRQ